MMIQWNTDAPPESAGELPYAMSIREWNYATDNPGEFVQHLAKHIGYTSLSPIEALRVREELAIEVAQCFQHRLPREATSNGFWDPHTAGEASINILAGTRRYPWPIAHWNHPIELVLVRSHYARPQHMSAPGGIAAMPDKVPAPRGNVIWIDPDTDESSLVSVTQVQVISYHGRVSGYRSGLGSSSDPRAF